MKDADKWRMFFFNDTATTEIYTLSLHDALPISWSASPPRWRRRRPGPAVGPRSPPEAPQAQPPRRMAATASWPRSSADRKSTRLNSSHANISYAVFCLKKKNLVVTNSHFPPHYL